MIVSQHVYIQISFLLNIQIHYSTQGIKMEQNTHTTTDLEQNLTVNETQQIIEEEQRTTTHENSHVDTPQDNIFTMNRFSMNIDEVSSRNILETPVIVSTTAWNAGDPVLTQLVSFNIPDIFTTLKNFHDTMLTTYSVFKPTIVFHFKLNSTPFHQGKVLCWYNPLNQLQPATSALDKTISLTSISMQPSVFLDASLANSGDIEIPFEFFKTYFNTNSDSGLPPMGSINVTIFNPLSSASGSSTTATIQILLSCKELQVHIPIAPHTVLFSSGSIGEAEDILEAEAQVFEAIGKGISNIWNTGKDVVQKGKEAFVNFKTGNFSGAFNSLRDGMGAIGNGLKNFNLDKPAILEATTHNTIYPIAPPPHMRGVDTSVRLGATPEGGYLTHDLFSSTAGSEHKIQTLARMKGFHDTTTWSTTDIPGTVLGVIPVAPWYQPLAGAPFVVNSITYQGLENTYLSYLATFFNFWRGSIAYRWDFVSSKMHSGRLAFILFPNDDPACKYGSSPANLNLSLYTNNPIYYFDLAESKTAELTVPFQSGTHMKWMLPPTQFINGPPTQLENYLTGTLAIVVVNQLMAPSSVTQSVTFNSFVGAGPDMEFEGPTSSSPGYFRQDVGQNPPPLFATAQSAEDPQPSRSNDVHPTNFLLKAGSPVARLDAYNEHIDDVRDLTRRYTLSTRMSIPMNNLGAGTYYTGSQAILNSPEVLLQLPSSVATLLRYSSFLNRISYLYAFWHGSIRYKILPSNTDRTKAIELTARYDFNSSNINAATLQTDAQWLVSADPYLWTNTSQQSALEVELPYYSIYTQLGTSSPLLTANQLLGTGWLYVQARTLDSGNLRAVGTEPINYFYDCTVLHAGGDDLAFSFPVAPPQTFYVKTS